MFKQIHGQLFDPSNLDLKFLSSCNWFKIETSLVSLCAVTLINFLYLSLAELERVLFQKT
jgi:hypothetical protein